MFNGKVTIGELTYEIRGGYPLLAITIEDNQEVPISIEAKSAVGNDIPNLLTNWAIDNDKLLDFLPRDGVMWLCAKGVIGVAKVTCTGSDATHKDVKVTEELTVTIVPSAIKQLVLVAGAARLIP